VGLPWARLWRGCGAVVARLWRGCGLSAELLGLAGLRSPKWGLARGSRIGVTRDCMIK
jgi:hypothetical protein